MTELPQTVYYWLICKVCHQVHSAELMSVDIKEMMSKSSNVGCPNNPGQYAHYTLGDWKIGTVADARKFSR